MAEEENEQEQNFEEGVEVMNEEINQEEIEYNEEIQMEEGGEEQIQMEEGGIIQNQEAQAQEGEEYQTYEFHTEVTVKPKTQVITRTEETVKTNQAEFNPPKKLPMKQTTTTTTTNTQKPGETTTTTSKYTFQKNNVPGQTTQTTKTTTTTTSKYTFQKNNTQNPAQQATTTTSKYSFQKNNTQKPAQTTRPVNQSNLRGKPMTPSGNTNTNQPTQQTGTYTLRSQVKPLGEPKLEFKEVPRGGKYNNVKSTYVYYTRFPPDFHVIENLHTGYENHQLLNLNQLRSSGKLKGNNDVKSSSKFCCCLDIIPPKQRDTTPKTEFFIHCGGEGMTKIDTEQGGKPSSHLKSKSQSRAQVTTTTTNKSQPTTIEKKVVQSNITRQGGQTQQQLKSGQTFPRQGAQTQSVRTVQTTTTTTRQGGQTQTVNRNIQQFKPGQEGQNKPQSYTKMVKNIKTGIDSKIKK